MELLRKGISCDKLMGAYLIRWQKAGYISIEERKNPQGKKEPEEVIVFRPEQTPSAAVEQSLYAILAARADPDGILWSSVIEKRAEKLYERLTEFEQAVRMIGFQKYLIGMKVQQKDGPAPRELWGDYLVFAALFDIGEQVLKSMEALDPAYFDTFSELYGYNSYRMVYFMTMTNHISTTAAPNVSGIGGAAGSVGGGGFSGGGGGGSR